MIELCTLVRITEELTMDVSETVVAGSNPEEPNRPASADRELWLYSLADLIWGVVEEVGGAPPRNVAIGVGHPRAGARSKTRGDVWPTEATNGGKTQLIISLAVAGDDKVAAALLEQILRSAVPYSRDKSARNDAFKALAGKVGLAFATAQRKPTLTLELEARLNDCIGRVVAELGHYDHKALNPDFDPGAKTQGTRMRRVACPECQHPSRMTTTAVRRDGYRFCVRHWQYVLFTDEARPDDPVPDAIPARPAQHADMQSEAEKPPSDTDVPTPVGLPPHDIDAPPLEGVTDGRHGHDAPDESCGGAASENGESRTSTQEAPASDVLSNPDLDTAQMAAVTTVDDLFSASAPESLCGADGSDSPPSIDAADAVPEKWSVSFPRAPSKNVLGRLRDAGAAFDKGRKLWVSHKSVRGLDLDIRVICEEAGGTFASTGDNN